jgi:hypothetical protein
MQHGAAAGPTGWWGEPNGLVIRWRDSEIPDCAGLIPNAVVIRGHDVEAVLFWPEIVVVGLPARSHILPIRVLAFEFVAEQDAVRIRETQGRAGMIRL